MTKQRNKTTAPSKSKVNAPSRQAKRTSNEATVRQTPWMVSTFLPNVIVAAVAYAVVACEYTTHPAYTHSKELNVFLKQCFIAFVCFGVRTQLLPLFAPSTKKQTLSLWIKAEIQGLIAAILANCGGTTIIQPLCGAAPQYEDTIRLVVPIYMLVAIVVGLLQVPIPLVQFAIGFAVSWLKAITVSKLIVQWQQEANAHPMAFVLISTANLFASGLVIQFVAHYYRSSKILNVSLSWIGSLLRVMLIGSAIGLVAHAAHHFGAQNDRPLEAFALRVIIAWYVLNKYWKNALLYLLTKPFATKVKQA